MRVNGKIRSREVRVIGPDGKQLGVFLLNDALALARQHHIDLPITEQVDAILHRNLPAREAIREIMDRPQKPESF